MLISEYVGNDAQSLAAEVQAGAITPGELSEVARSVVAKLNGTLNVVLETFEDEPDREGPFRGVPFLVKDLILQRAGGLCEMGSRLSEGFRASVDSELMRRFRVLGLNTIGRTNTPEFGLCCTTEPVLRGPTRNPWNPDHMVGGSSGGSAAAVAAGMVPVAHGNDGAGSLRGPAACCGIFAMKPSRGRITAGPSAGDALFGIVTEGVMSRTVRDSAAFLDRIAGPMPGDPYVIASPAEPYLSSLARDPARLRIAVALEPWSGAPIDGEVIAAVRDVAHLCEDIGHHVDYARPDLDFESYRHANIILSAAAVARMVDDVRTVTGRTPSPETLETATLAMYEYGKTIGAAELLTVPSIFNAVTRSFGGFFQDWDILITPATATPAPAIGTYDQNAAGLTPQSWFDWKGSFVPFLAAFNMTGQPAMSLPLCQSDSGLPIGIQAAADFGREDLLFGLAGQLERARPWAGRVPHLLKAL